MPDRRERGFKSGIVYNSSDGKSTDVIFISLDDEENFYTIEQGFKIAAAILATAVQAGVPHHESKAEKLRAIVSEEIKDKLTNYIEALKKVGSKATMNSKPCGCDPRIQRPCDYHASVMSVAEHATRNFENYTGTNVPKLVFTWNYSEAVARELIADLLNMVKHVYDGR